MRRNVIFLVGTLVVVLGSLLATILSGNRPILGLDLQGGVSVVLAPCAVNPDDPSKCVDEGKRPSNASLDKAVDIIRQRVDGLGVAEPEVSRQGQNIVVDLPGVKNRDKASELVGRTAELRFRPVLAILPPEDAATSSSSSTSSTTGKGGSTTSSSSTTTTTTVPPDDAATRAAIASCDPAQVQALPEIPTTSIDDDDADACVVLADRQGGDQSVRYLLGPAALTGRGVSGATAQFQTGGGGWSVNLELNGEGETAFNALAAESFPKQPPQNAVAIVLDGVVQSAPAFQDDNFAGGSVSITGDFSQSEASDLSTVLEYGALPVTLRQLSASSVSPTLGTDQLRAGIAAGIIGVVLVGLYMIAYYRLLGLVVIAGLALTAASVFSLISFLGSTWSLTLTLAGVTGLIVSVGVTVDSYVVYFERLKDEVRSGKTVRSSVDRGFARSFRTILAADLVSLLGAAVLYFLAIGSVRGFALFLGISTLLDLAVSYFFMHPLVAILSRNRALVRVPKIGIAAGLDAKGATL